MFKGLTKAKSGIKSQINFLVQHLLNSHKEQMKSLYTKLRLFNIKDKIKAIESHKKNLRL